MLEEDRVCDSSVITKVLVHREDFVIFWHIFSLKLKGSGYFAEKDRMSSVL